MTVKKYAYVISKEGDRHVIIYDPETGRGIKCIESFGFPPIGLVKFLKTGEFKQPKIENPLSQELSSLLISQSEFLAKIDNWERRKDNLMREFNSYPDYLPEEERPHPLYAKNIPLDVRTRIAKEEKIIEEEINSLK